MPDEDVERYYDANIEQFQTPETRDVRVILNPDAAEIDAAIEDLGDSPTPEDWEAAAKKYSTDEATKNQGGLRRAVAEGQNEPALDEAIFSAEQGEVVGPIEGDSGSYVIQVEEVSEAATTPLDDVRDQIVQTLQQGISQDAITRFRDSFIAKWTSRTFCDEAVVVDLCSNAPPPPEVCTIDDASEREAADPATLEAGCPALRACPAMWSTPEPVQCSQASSSRPSRRAPTSLPPRRPSGCPRASPRSARVGLRPLAHRPRALRPLALRRAAHRPPSHSRNRRVGARARAPRRHHPPPAARLPVGSRAGRALDRAAHGRGGRRAGRRR